jgi:Imidazoleglycerol-phosphate synthase
LITKGAEKFGNQCIVVAIDVKESNGKYLVHTHGGKKATEIDAIKWAKKVEELGAGELLITSMDKDGTKDGFDISLYQAINKVVNIPIIASGGAGKVEDFTEVFEQADVDGALAASVFHFGELSINDVKQTIRKAGVPVR